MRLSTGPLTGCRRAGLVNGEAVNTGSRKAIGSRKGLHVGSGSTGFGNVCNSDLVFDYVNGGLTYTTVNGTRTCSAASRSVGNYGLGSVEGVCKRTGSLNDYLKSLVRAVLTLNYGLTGFVAVGLLNDAVNVANTVTVGNLFVDTVIVSRIELAGRKLTAIAIIVCTPLIPEGYVHDVVADVIIGLIGIPVVIALVDNLNCVAVLSNSSIVCNLVSGLYGNNVTAFGTGAGLGCLSVGVAGGIGYKSPIAVCVVLFALKLSPVGEDRRFTSFTLVNGVAPLAALSGNDLDEYVGSIRHSMLCANTGTGDAISVRLAACCIRSCENGNNTADAHHDGKEKSTNSFRIVLH